MLFPVRAIQVDASLRFKLQFEAACQQPDLQLSVLPPRSPKLNGHVEPAQRTQQEEFYQVVHLPHTLPRLRERLRTGETVYNTIRPHQALGEAMPWGFCQGWLAGQAEKG